MISMGEDSLYEEEPPASRPALTSWVPVSSQLLAFSQQPVPLPLSEESSPGLRLSVEALSPAPHSSIQVSGNHHLPSAAV